MSALRRPVRMILYGPPGSGKGTQTGRLQKWLGIEAVSSGDILRNQIASQSDIGKKAKNLIGGGGLVPDDMISELVKAEFSKRGWLRQDKSWLLDGFPRTVGQAKFLDQTLIGQSELNFVVELQVPSRVILDRIANRLVHVKSGRIYNLTYNPPKVPGVDDITGEPLERRPDDDPVVFGRRLDQYAKETEPILKYYRERGLLWSVAGDTSDVIYKQLSHEMAQRFL
ncbi:adenylate kinase [Dipodascopsis uninucleata]